MPRKVGIADRSPRSETGFGTAIPLATAQRVSPRLHHGLNMREV